MKHLKFLFIIFINFIIAQDNHLAVIDSYLKNYKRPFTVLEVCITGNRSAYSFLLSEKYDATAVLMILGRLPYTYDFSFNNQYENLVVVNPYNFNLQELETLTRCEHFDAVIVHGLPFGLKKDNPLQINFSETLDLILKLGDVTFFEALHNDINLNDLCNKKGGTIISRTQKSNLYQFNFPKKGLDIARWILKSLPVSESPRYPILSTFEKKVYFKNNKEIIWHKGINFSTFVMLRGIYPSEIIIRKNLEEMRKLEHNDLIIGNMVIQGKKIIVIDVNDPRWNADLQKCIDTALTVFDGNNFRLKDPEACLLTYRQGLSNKNKK